MLANVTIEPRSPSTRGWSIILARAALATKKVPVRLIAITRSHSARSSRWTRAAAGNPCGGGDTVEAARHSGQHGGDRGLVGHIGRHESEVRAEVRRRSPVGAHD